MFGNRSRLPIDVLLSVRGRLLRQRATTVLAIVTLASSVALSASVEIASRSVRAAVERTSRAWLGAASLQIGAGDAGIDESALETVRAVPGVARATPIIERTFRVSGDGTAVRVLGIDLLEEDSREGAIAARGIEVQDPVRLVALGDSIIVTPRLAERTKTAAGDAIEFRSERGTHRLVVRGLLSGGPADAFDGQIAVMDLYAMQDLLGLGRRVTRIDVERDPGESAEALRERIALHLGEHVTVRRAGVSDGAIDGLLTVLTSCVSAMAGVGVLLAILSIHAVASLSVDRRIEELAWLRAVGMDADRVSRLVLLDAAIVSVFATALGLAVAVVACDPLLDRLARASEHLQQLSITPAGASVATVLAALGTGLPVALLATLGPARRVARGSALDLLQDRKQFLQTPFSSRVGRAAGAAAVAAIACAWFAREGGAASVLLLLSVGLGVFSVAALASQLPSLVTGERAFRLGTTCRMGAVAAASFAGRGIELAATTAVWAGIVGAALALGSTVDSVAKTMDAFLLGLNGREATLVYAEDPGSVPPANREPIRRETLAELEALPGVEAVAAYRNVQVVIRGERVALGNLPTELLVRHGGLQTVSADPEASIAALRRGEILMSEAFRWRFGTRIGDSLALQTPAGTRLVRVGGWARDYSGRSGSLHVDDRIFREWFGDLPASFAALFLDGDPATVIENARSRVTGQALFFRDAEVHGRQTRMLVGQVESLLRLPWLLVVGIGVITLVNLLLGNTLAHRHEYALFRAAGATSSTLGVSVVLHGLFVAGAGGIAGLAFGAVWGHSLCGILSRSLGWVIDHRITLSAGTRLMAATLAMALLASLLPARLAARMSHARRTPGSPG